MDDAGTESLTGPWARSVRAAWAEVGIVMVDSSDPEANRCESADRGPRRCHHRSDRRNSHIRGAGAVSEPSRLAGGPRVTLTPRPQHGAPAPFPPNERRGRRARTPQVHHELLSDPTHRVGSRRSGYSVHARESVSTEPDEECADHQVHRVEEARLAQERELDEDPADEKPSGHRVGDLGARVAAPLPHGSERARIATMRASATPPRTGLANGRRASRSAPIDSLPVARPTAPADVERVGTRDNRDRATWLVGDVRASRCRTSVGCGRGGRGGTGQSHPTADTPMRGRVGTPLADVRHDHRAPVSTVGAVGPRAEGPEGGPGRGRKGRRSHDDGTRASVPRIPTAHDRPMRTLLMNESSTGLAHAEVLRRSGHEVVRCTRPGSSLMCSAASGSCPLDEPVDVAVVVHDGVSAKIPRAHRSGVRGVTGSPS